MTTEDISLGDFVQQLLLALGDQELPFKDDRPWHELFYDLKSAPARPGKPRFLEHLFFDWNGPYPRCQELSEYLHGLHWTNCMSAANPTYERFRLNPQVGEMWRVDQIENELRDYIGAAAEAARRELAIAG